MNLKYFRICLLVIIPFYLYSCTGFNRLEHIVGPYYLVEVDTKNDLDISYELKNGDYVGKIPSTILEYGFNDSFLIAKTKDYSDQIQYYIVDRRKDFDLAHEEDFRIGPISQNEFLNSWKDRLKIRMKSAK
jgi:hypothetical protein